MTSALFSGHVLGRITRAARKAKQARVALAYLSRGASRRLPLGEGSVLIVNFGLTALRTGQTDPKEVLKYPRRGVAVHSAENLHAKVASPLRKLNTEARLLVDSELLFELGRLWPKASWVLIAPPADAMRWRRVGRRTTRVSGKGIYQ